MEIYASVICCPCDSICKCISRCMKPEKNSEENGVEINETKRSGGNTALQSNQSVVKKVRLQYGVGELDARSDELHGKYGIAQNSVGSDELHNKYGIAQNSMGGDELHNKYGIAQNSVGSDDLHNKYGIAQNSGGSDGLHGKSGILGPVRVKEEPQFGSRDWGGRSDERTATGGSSYNSGIIIY